MDGCIKIIVRIMLGDVRWVWRGIMFEIVLIVNVCLCCDWDGVRMCFYVLISGLLLLWFFCGL